MQPQTHKSLLYGQESVGWTRGETHYYYLLCAPMEHSPVWHEAWPAAFHRTQVAPREHLEVEVKTWPMWRIHDQLGSFPIRHTWVASSPNFVCDRPA